MGEPRATGDVDEVLARVLEPGQNIVIAQGTGFPRTLVEALPRHRERMRGSRVLVGLIPERFPALAGCELVTFFPSGALGTEEGLKAHDAHYVRWTLFELSSGLRDGTIPVDVALGQATLARDGLHSLGTNADFIAPALDRAAVSVLEVSELMPWTRRGVEVAAGPGRLTAPSRYGPSLAVESEARPNRLASELLRWIPDGATIELGMGRWFAPLVSLLAEQRRGLRVHSGSIGDWVTTLRVAGVLDPSQPVVGTAARGTAAFYKELEDRDDIVLAPAHHTHAPAVLGQLPSFRAVNSVLEVDLMGRANSEFAPGGRIGGIAGLPDFARAAAGSADGLSIVALNSTAGAASRIVPRLAASRPSLERCEIDIVVTEQGSADLRGLDPEACARALTAVASPEHRDSLRVASRQLQDV